MANEKEIPKVLCLYHLKTECHCIHPVTNNKLLIERIKNQIKINDILNKYEKNKKEKEGRNRELILLENRLSDLEKS